MDDLIVKYGTREWAAIMTMRGYEVQHGCDTAIGNPQCVVASYGRAPGDDDGWSLNEPKPLIKLILNWKQIWREVDEAYERAQNALPKCPTCGHKNVWEIDWAIQQKTIEQIVNFAMEEELHKMKDKELRK